MPVSDGDREKYFPLIEKRYGEKMSYWFKVMKELEGEKYPVQVAHLKENYGFSQAHANALVMYSRGSLSSKRHESPAQYFKTLDPQQAKTAKAIFKTIQTKYPDLKLVMAWNKPMLMKDKSYIFGLAPTKNYILIAPWNMDVFAKYIPQFDGYKVNKKTIAVPNDWEIDSKILLGMIKDSLAAIK